MANTEIIIGGSLPGFSELLAQKMNDAPGAAIPVSVVWNGNNICFRINNITVWSSDDNQGFVPSNKNAVLPQQTYMQAWTGNEYYLGIDNFRIEEIP